MKKGEILYRLQEKNIMREMHEHTVSGLVGNMQNEYCPHCWQEPPKHLEYPIFKATINMLVSYLLSGFAEKIIDEVLEIISTDLE